MEARLDRSAARETPRTNALGVARSHAGDEERGADQSTTAAPSVKRQSLEDIRREARENWLRLRQAQNRAQGQDVSESGPVTRKDRTRDDDLGR